MKIRISFAIAIAMMFSSVVFLSCAREGMEMDEQENGSMESTYQRVAGVVSASDSGSCFSFVFPLSITLPDGSTESFATGAEFLAFHEVWEDANPDGPEFPTISYPIDVTLDDGSSVSIPDEEVLDDMLDECEGEDDDDYDDDDYEDDDDEDDEDDD